MKILCRMICKTSQYEIRMCANQCSRVVFFNLGMHHVPHSGDIPNTLMHTAASSVMFTPFNFHDRDPSRLTSQGVQLDINSKKTKPRYFGRTYDEGVRLKKVYRLFYPFYSIP
jgi:hypothetical protein